MGRFTSHQAGGCARLQSLDNCDGSLTLYAGCDWVFENTGGVGCSMLNRHDAGLSNPSPPAQTLQNASRFADARYE
jgi:hypothetical protein